MALLDVTQFIRGEGGVKPVALLDVTQFIRGEGGVNLVALLDATEQFIRGEGGINQVALLDTTQSIRGQSGSSTGHYPIYQKGGVNQDNTRVQSFTDALGPVSVVDDSHDVIF